MANDPLDNNRSSNAPKTADKPQPKEEAHEDTPLKARNFLLALVGLGALIGVALLMAGIIYAVSPKPIPPGQVQQQPPEPRLQTAPASDMTVLRATQIAQINTYGYVDKRTGQVHIPIDRAMQILAQNGEAAVNAASQNRPTLSPGDLGAQLFMDYGCNGCHTEQAGAVGPNLKGIFNTQVKLANGQTVTADEAYLKESILNPNAKVVAGFQPIMPSFQGRVNDQDLAALLAYLEGLK